MLICSSVSSLLFIESIPGLIQRKLIVSTLPAISAATLLTSDGNWSVQDREPIRFGPVFIGPGPDRFHFSLLPDRSRSLIGPPRILGRSVSVWHFKNIGQFGFFIFKDRCQVGQYLRLRRFSRHLIGVEGVYQEM